jgi:phosphatidylglycerophosphate synthase
MSTQPNANKLPEHYDDPVDIYLKKWADVLNPHFKDAGFTPNIITTMSFLCGLYSCYLYYKQSYTFSSLFYFISYFFDVMDGYFARLYNMKSKFGSYYDTLSDCVVGFLILYLFLTNKHILNFKYINTKVVIIIIYTILFILALYHMSCQETYTKLTKEEYISESLFILETIKCKNYKHMNYTKYFGTGVLSVTIAIGIFLNNFITK